MGFPVKVPEVLYAQIKGRAEREGRSLQKVLVEMLTEPRAALEELGAQIHRELRPWASAWPRRRRNCGPRSRPCRPWRGTCGPWPQKSRSFPPTPTPPTRTEQGQLSFRLSQVEAVSHCHPGQPVRGHEEEASLSPPHPPVRRPSCPWGLRPRVGLPQGGAPPRSLRRGGRRGLACRGALPTGKTSPGFRAFAFQEEE